MLPPRPQVKKDQWGRTLSRGRVGGGEPVGFAIPPRSVAIAGDSLLRRALAIGAVEKHSARSNTASKIKEEGRETNINNESERE